MSKAKAFLDNQPLTPPIFYILLALTIKESHGYEIMKQVREDSQGKVVLGPGTLYGAMKRMLEDKLIIEIINKTNTRRRYYKLTEKGRKIFTHELERYNEAVQLARKRSLFTNPSVIYA